MDILTLIDQNGKITPGSLVNPLSRIDPNGNWWYYLYNLPTDIKTSLTLTTKNGKALKKLYYVLYGTGGTGGRVGTIDTAITTSNYPGGGGGGGCGQVYPINANIEASGNSYPVSISNPIFPLQLITDLSGAFKIIGGNFYTAVVFGRSGINGSGYNGGAGGRGGTPYEPNVTPGLTGQGGGPGVPNGVPGSPTTLGNQVVTFADNTVYGFVANKGGQWSSTSTSSTNGNGQGGTPGYVMFYYNESDVL